MLTTDLTNSNLRMQKKSTIKPANLIKKISVKIKTIEKNIYNNK